MIECETVYFLWLFRVVVVPVILLYLINHLWTREVEKDLTSIEKTLLPPGHYGIPLLGETINYVKKCQEWSHRKSARLGCIYKSHLLGSPTIRVCSGDAVRSLLKRHQDLLQPMWPESVRTILGHGALVNILDPDAHRSRRSFLHSHLFSKQTLTSYELPCAKIVYTQFERLATMSQKNKVNIQIFVESQCLMIKLIACLLLELDDNSANSELICQIVQQFTEIKQNIFCIPLRLPWPLNAFCRGVEARRKFDNLLDNVIANSNSTRLQALLSPNVSDQVSMNELKDAIIELLFAGHHTTSVALSSIIGLLADNQKIVDAIIEEDRNVCLQDESNNFYITNSLALRPILTAVIRESLHYFAPVGAVYRSVVKSFVFENYLFPKGWTVACCIRDSMEKASLYNNKDKSKIFKEKMEDVIQSVKLTNNSFQSRRDKIDLHFPFGMGNRICIGKQFAELVLSVATLTLVKHFQWSLSEGERFYYRDGIFSSPSNGLPIYINKR